jgi:sugar lactone lactonase YvrE
MTRSNPRLAPRFPIALALIASALLEGCASAPVVQMVWPPPPDKGRVRFLRAIHQDGDVAAGALHKLWRLLVPAAPETIIRQPVAIALSPDDKRLYVANAVRGNVVEVNLETGNFSLAGTDGRRVVGRPTAVAVDAEGSLYVADDSTSTIVVYDRKGAFLREFGQGKLDQPKAMALDRKAQILYVVNGASQKSQAHRVDLFSLQGEHLRTVGKRGSGPLEFNFPAAIAVGPDGRAYVVDMLNFRVQIFDAEGTFRGEFGQLGAGVPGTFEKAKGIAHDTFGNIYVTEGAHGFIQIFNPDLQPLMAFAGRGLDPGYLKVPGAIAIDSRNHIFVADTTLQSVFEYELFDTSAEDSRGTVH